MNNIQLFGVPVWALGQGYHPQLHDPESALYQQLLQVCREREFPYGIDQSPLLTLGDYRVDLCRGVITGVHQPPQELVAGIEEWLATQGIRLKRCTLAASLYVDRYKQETGSLNDIGRSFEQLRATDPDDLIVTLHADDEEHPGSRCLLLERFIGSGGLAAMLGISPERLMLLRRASS